MFKVYLQKGNIFIKAHTTLSKYYIHVIKPTHEFTLNIRTRKPGILPNMANPKNSRI